MKDKLFEEMAYNILEDYTRAYSEADKDTLARYLRTKFEEYSVGDRVAVVRCKDCSWWEVHSYGSTVGWCQNPINGLVSEYCDDEDFCSYGERKEK